LLVVGRPLGLGIASPPTLHGLQSNIFSFLPAVSGLRNTSIYPLRTHLSRWSDWLRPHRFGAQHRSRSDCGSFVRPGRLPHLETSTVRRGTGATRFHPPGRQQHSSSDQDWQATTRRTERVGCNGPVHLWQSVSGKIGVVRRMRRDAEMEERI